jgi:hypothetical protein
MALKLTNVINPTTGQTCAEAYARITNFYGTKDQIQVQVAIHYNAESRQANHQTIKENAHYIGIDDLKGDLIPAIYTSLKTLTEYAGATDV